MRVVVKLGNVFSASLDEKSRKYFQYVANDMTQLNSQVIRVFQKIYPLDATQDLQEVVCNDVEFYAHVVIRWGIQMGLWEKVGSVKEIGEVNVLFRRTSDYGKKIGEPDIEKSENWSVWRINEPFRRVGKLEGEDRAAEIGLVVAPPDIIDRMRTGKYNFVYPGY